jgi:hypothetical protein
MAMPASASASAGASLIPSPTPDRSVVVSAPGEPRGTADGDAIAVDGALDPLPGVLERLTREAEVEAARLSGVDERLCEPVRRDLVERGGDPQQLVLAQPVERNDALDLWSAEGDGPGLVEKDRARRAELLDHAGALDDHAGPRRARDPGDERDRRGQD